MIIIIIIIIIITITITITIIIIIIIIIKTKYAARLSTRMHVHNVLIVTGIRSTHGDMGGIFVHLFNARMFFLR